ncbi:hypothetical protein JCGZ_19387 [Jatropha curcas]|uniref:Aminotransferase-like plant mobile domain-containing protein n=1 Tax=Jatropha curcas TaxID=180498 RepID=A0A067K3C4_JATCU|nr:hypothetical protein JCGZ_19387 [Jatropha curcas]
MSQIPEIPASAYTPEMETLGALPDIPTFDGEPVPEPESTNPQDTAVAAPSVTGYGVPGQLHDAATKMRDATSWLRDATVGWRGASAELLCTSQNKGDLAVLACLRDLSQVESFDWATLGLAHLYHGLDVWTRGSGESNWLFIQPLEVWSYEYCIYPGGASGDSPVESRRIPRYLAHCHHTYASGEDPEYWLSFLNDRELSDLSLTPWDCEAWRTYSGREVAELYTRSRLLMREYWVDWYFLGERVFDTPVAPARRRVPHAPPRHMCLLKRLTRGYLEVEYRGFSANDFLSAGYFPSYFASRMQARLPEILEYIQERKTHKTAAHYRAEAAAEAGGAATPAGPAGVVLGDMPFPPGMEVVLDPGLELENGRLRRHQSRQSSAVSRLQAEVERLQTRLEVEGIPLDSSGEDGGGSRHHLHLIQLLLVRATGSDSSVPRLLHF